MAMNDVRVPAQFLDGFQDAACKEDGAFIVVLVFYAGLVCNLKTVLEEILIVYEINLYAGRLK